MDDDSKGTPPPPAPPKTDSLNVLTKAVRDPSVNRIYANGFTIGISNADAHIVLSWFGQPLAIVNISYTLAKTLSLKLNKLVEDWEKKTKHPLATTDVIDEAFKDAK